MRDRGFGDDYVERYKMVTKFFQQRRPLMVLLCGVPCTGMHALHETLCRWKKAPLMHKHACPAVVIHPAWQSLCHAQACMPLTSHPIFVAKLLSFEGLVLGSPSFRGSLCSDCIPQNLPDGSPAGMIVPVMQASQLWRSSWHPG